MNSEVRIGLRGVETLWEITVLRHYLDSMEEQLQESNRTARMQLCGELQVGSKESYDEFLSYVQLHDGFYDEQLRTLRFSFMVRAHILFETHIRSFCRALRVDRAIPVGFRELNGNPVEKAKVFCTKLISLLPEDHACWPALRELQLVRNCIVHTYGSLEGFGEPKALRALAAKHIGVSVQDEMLAIENVFCRHALAVVHDFFRNTFRAAGWKRCDVELRSECSG